MRNLSWRHWPKEAIKWKWRNHFPKSLHKIFLNVSHFLYFYLFNICVVYKNTPMTGFELWTSGIGSNRSANLAITTAPHKTENWTSANSFNWCKLKFELVYLKIIKKIPPKHSKNFHDAGFRVSALPRHRHVDHLLVLEYGVMERLEGDLNSLILQLFSIIVDAFDAKLERTQVCKSISFV